MSEIETKPKEENDFNKELFNLNLDKVSLTHIKEMIKMSKNGPKYFIDLFDHYSKCRPHQHNVCKELVDCVYSCFPEQINEIQQNIRNTEILKFIIFPEEFQINENKEQKEMFSLLQKDDIDGFISFLS